MSEYNPDVWVVIEIKGPDGESIRKVLAGWYGGYAGSDSWKLSSGITETKDMDTHYEFHNASGSIYYCHKQCERLSGYTSSIYSSIKEKEKDGWTVEIIDYATV